MKEIEHNTRQTMKRCERYVENSKWKVNTNCR